MILTKEQYIQFINELLPDNSTRQISPADLRESLINLVDSVPNFNTDFTHLDTRTTRGGKSALSKYGLPGRYNEDNSAFGYYALGGNYNGIKNTACGSHSLGCNLYGDGNTAIGYNTLAGNVDGSGNVALGNNALRNNKHGDFNIAIGHGAGYYIGQNDNYKLYVASHPIDFDLECEIPTGSGTPPLLHGDLSTLRLGIGVKELHSYGALQVAGNVTPSTDDFGSIGRPQYRWRSLFLSSGVGYLSTSKLSLSMLTETAPDQYSQQPVITASTSGRVAIGTGNALDAYGMLTVAGNIVPAQDCTYTLGHPDYRWNAVYSNLEVSGDITGINIEGIAKNTIAKPTCNSAPTSGLMIVKDKDWNTTHETYILNRDTTLSIPSGAYIVATKICCNYRPIWVSCSGNNPC